MCLGEHTIDIYSNSGDSQASDTSKVNIKIHHLIIFNKTDNLGIVESKGINLCIIDISLYLTMPWYLYRETEVIVSA